MSNFSLKIDKFSKQFLIKANYFWLSLIDLIKIYLHERIDHLYFVYFLPCY